MNLKSLEILSRDDLPLGGFAGLTEHRLVTDVRAFGPYAEAKAWPGLGRFVYLADARFRPNGETRMHPHREVDVISVMLEGRIAHEGSLEHGQELEPFNVQVQRAGGEGFMHNEVNPDATENRMLQLWFLPEEPGQKAGYQLFKPDWGEVIRVYGGAADQSETFASHTQMEVGLLKPEQTLERAGAFMVYVATGEGIVNGQPVKEGDLIRGEDLSYVALGDSVLILIAVL